MIGYVRVLITENTRVIFCELSKAFDRVWNDGLIHNLQGYVFRNNIADWLNSNRKQRVNINSIWSSYLTVKSDVPQGSILDPF